MTDNYIFTHDETNMTKTVEMNGGTKEAASELASSHFDVDGHDLYTVDEEGVDAMMWDVVVERGEGGRYVSELDGPFVRVLDVCAGCGEKISDEKVFGDTFEDQYRKSSVQVHDDERCEELAVAEWCDGGK